MSEEKITELIKLLIQVNKDITPNAIQVFLSSLKPNEKAIVAEIMRICFQVGQMNSKRPLKEMPAAILDSRPIQ